MKGFVKRFLCLPLFLLILLSLAFSNANAEVIKDFKMVTSGKYHSVALRNDGTVLTWGQGEGALHRVKGLNDVIAVAAGYNFSLALKNDGTVWRWSNSGGYNSASDESSTDDPNKPVKIEGLSNIKSIACGYRHIIALSKEGSLYGLGENSYGQLGMDDNTVYNVDIPTEITSITDVKAVYCGEYHTAVIMNDGSLWTFGNNGDGQLGIMSTKYDEFRPTKVTGIPPVKSADLTYNNTYAVDVNGNVWGWGRNDYNKIGKGAYFGFDFPQLIDGISNVEMISAGYYHVVAVKDDKSVWGWGYNGSGQLGKGDWENSNTPVKLEKFGSANAVSAGDYFTNVLNTDSEILTAGYDGYNNTRTIPEKLIDEEAPAPPSKLRFEGDNKLVWEASEDRISNVNYVIFKNDVQIAKTRDLYFTFDESDKNSSYYIKAADESGNISETSNLVGNDTEAPTVPEGLFQRSVTSGNVALSWKSSTDNISLLGYEVYCNGTKINDVFTNGFIHSGLTAGVSNKYRVRAYDSSGNYSDFSDEIAVTTLKSTDIKKRPLSAGVFGTLAIKDKNTIWAFGANAFGVDEALKCFPWQVKGLEDVRQVAAAYKHNLALKGDGTVWAWGSNDKGQLGDNTIGSSLLPQMVPGLEGIISISSNGYTSAALKNDGTLWMWGSTSSYYEYGSNVGYYSSTDIKKPYKLEGLPKIASFEVSKGGIIIAVAEDGSAWISEVIEDSFPSKTITKYVFKKYKGLENITSIAAGDRYKLALSADGKLWSFDYYSPNEVEGIENAVEVYMGLNYYYARTLDGNLYSWGSNESGQLGNGTTTTNEVPALVNSFKASEISTGGKHVVIIDEGKLQTFGSNIYKQLGNVKTEDKYTPSQVIDEYQPQAPDMLKIKVENGKIILSWNPSKDNIDILSYEIYKNGQKVADVNTNSYQEDYNAADKYEFYVVAIDTSNNKSAASKTAIYSNSIPDAPENFTAKNVSQGIVYLKWASKDENLLYIITRDNEKIAVIDKCDFVDKGLNPGKAYVYKVSSMSKSGFESTENASLSVSTKAIDSIPVAAGNYSSITLINGEAYYTGENIITADGKSSNESIYFPRKFEGIDNIAAVLNVAGYGVFLKNDGKVYSSLRYSKPSQITGLENIVAMNGYDYYGYDGKVLFVRNDGRVFEWRPSSKEQPLMIDDAYDVIKASGYGHNLYLTIYGTVKASGNNYNGELGIGNQNTVNSIVDVKNIDGIVDITTGPGFSFAVKADGSVYSWGLNSNGQLGDLSSYSKSLPNKIDLSSVLKIFTGERNTGAISSSGDIYIWGSSYNNLLGYEATGNMYAPKKLDAISNVEYASISDAHGILKVKNGTYYFWGMNNYGQFGNGSKSGSVTPLIQSDVKDTIAPSKPENLNTSYSNGWVELRWDSSTDSVGVVGYEITKNNVVVGSTQANIYNVKLDEGSYTFRIRAFDASNNYSSYSEELKLEIKLDKEPPAAPQNLTAQKGEKDVTLSWDKVTDSDLLGYRIYKDNSRGFTEITDTLFTYSNESNYSHYCYITSVDKSYNESLPSNIVYFRPKTPDLIVTDISVAGDVYSGKEITVNYTVKNIGDLKISQNVNETIEFVNYGSIKANSHEISLLPGESMSYEVKCIIPLNISDEKYLFVRADGYYNIEELDENNNLSDKIKLSITGSDLKVGSVSVADSVYYNQQLKIKYDILNVGQIDIIGQNYYNSVYISDSDVFSYDKASQLTSGSYNISLKSGETVSHEISYNIPRGFTGEKYIYVVADSNYYFSETDEKNNISAPSKVNFIVGDLPDLTVKSISVADMVYKNDKVSFSYDVTNSGKLALTSGWYDYFYISDKPTFDSSAVYITYKWNGNSNLSVGGTMKCYSSFTIPKEMSGKKYLFIINDKDDSIYESDEKNNYNNKEIIISDKMPDLVVKSINVNDICYYNSIINISYEVQNIGDYNCNNSHSNYVYLMDSPVFDENKAYINGTTYYSINAGGTYKGSISFTLTKDYIGRGYLFICTDLHNNIIEKNEKNNVSQPVKLNISQDLADLRIKSFSVADTVYMNDNVLISYEIENVGTGKVNSYNEMSTNVLIADQGDLKNEISLANFTDNVNIEPGKSVKFERTFKLPKNAVGKKYIYIKADTNNRVYEADESNNSSELKPVIVSDKLADLVVKSITVPEVAITNRTINVTWEVRNEGDYKLDADVWYDSLFISKTPDFSSNVTFLGQAYFKSLGVGESYKGEKSFNIPSNYEGKYYILVKADTEYSYYSSPSYKFFEKDFKNNEKVSVAFDVYKKASDLVVTEVNTSENPLSGNSIKVRYTPIFDS